MNTGFEALADAHLESPDNICDNCEKPCDDIYETADGDYVCLECHIACPEPDDDMYMCSSCGHVHSSNYNHNEQDGGTE